MSKKNRVLVPGQQVRVSRASYHYAVFGAIGRVVAVHGSLRKDDDVTVSVMCDFKDGGDYELTEQFIEQQHLTPIKKVRA